MVLLYRCSSKWTFVMRWLSIKYEYNLRERRCTSTIVSCLENIRVFGLIRQRAINRTSLSGDTIPTISSSISLPTLSFFSPLQYLSMMCRINFCSPSPGTKLSDKYTVKCFQFVRMNCSNRWQRWYMRNVPGLIIELWTVTLLLFDPYACCCFLFRLICCTFILAMGAAPSIKMPIDFRTWNSCTHSSNSGSKCCQTRFTWDSV